MQRDCLWDEILQGEYVAQRIVPLNGLRILVNGEETRLKVEVFRQLLMQYNGPITPMMQANREWLVIR